METITAAASVENKPDDEPATNAQQPDTARDSEADGQRPEPKEFRVDLNFLPDLKKGEAKKMPIMEFGNFFIMDSEQLVSNPFAELQQEAVSQQQAEAASKRNSMTERLTSVKNNVCENHFLMARSRLEREKTSRLKQLHDHSNKLRHEVKLLDLDKQRRQVEIKRRVEPQKDHSYDEAQVSNTEKRLGANIASFYLDKRLKYPVRIRSVSDISLTPTVQRARSTLRQSELRKSITPGDENHHVSSSTVSRAQTAKSAASSNNPPRPCLLHRRRDSRSAPLYSRPPTRGNPDGTQQLPAISSSHQRNRPASGIADGGGRTGNEGGAAPPPVVKFAFENPLKILASNEESAKLFSRAAYYPGATRAAHHSNHGSHLYSDDSDDDDLIDPNLPDRIDLRAMFFSKDCDAESNGVSGDPHRMSSGSLMTASTSGFTAHQLAMLRKAQGPPPRLTTDMMQVENDKINSKVKSFMTTLAASNAAKKSRKFSLIDELSNYEEEPVLPPRPSKVSTRGTNTMNDNKMDSFVDETGEDKENEEIGEYPQEQQTPPKYSYKLIRGRDIMENGQPGSRSIKPEDLVLQALTGVPMRDVLHTHVPLHSASRALRHTSTFKMHKVVERLIHERTKYQRHQVDELKKQMNMEAGSEADGGQVISSVLNSETQSIQPAASTDGSLPRRVSRVSLTSVGSDKKVAAR